MTISTKNSIRFQSLPHFCLDYLQSYDLIIKLNNIPITIAAIYSTSKHKITIQHYSNYINSINNICILGSDFNAEHHFWSCRTNNLCCQILENFVTKVNLKVHPPSGLSC
jgi:hypothetical protein